MMTEPDRVQVLKMVEAGQISPDEGIRLLNSTNRPVSLADMANRWLHVRVTDMSTQRPKVNVNLPLAWVAVGLRIGSHYSPELRNLDLDEILEAIRDGSQGRIVEVEDSEDGNRVEVYIE